MEGIKINIIKNINVTLKKHCKAHVISMSWTGYEGNFTSRAYLDRSQFFQLKEKSVRN